MCIRDRKIALLGFWPDGELQRFWTFILPAKRIVHDIMAALPAGLSLVFDCLRGTSPDTGHAVGAAALPYGFSAFNGYVVQRTSQGAFSAGDTLSLIHI